MKTTGRNPERVIYPCGLDDIRKENYRNAGLDPEVSVAYRVAEWFGLPEDAVCASGAAEDAGDVCEVLIGATGKKATDDVLKILRPDQYGIFCAGGKIVVCGHCAASTLWACEELLQLSPEELTEGFEKIFTHEAWAVEFPPFNGGIYRGMSDACFEQVIFVWESVTPEEVVAYANGLTQAGYVLTYTNELDGNLCFRCESGERFLILNYAPAGGIFRLTSGIRRGFSIDPERIRLGEAVPEGKVSLTQMTLDYTGGSFGMCYVITLTDGSFVIIDGGQVRVKNGYPKSYDFTRLYYLLKELNVREDGKILIRAWMMTHEHSDHFNVFYWFCREYGREVTLERYYACPCSDTVAFNAKNPEFHTSAGKLQKISDWVGGMEIVALHTGDRFAFGDLDFEVLYVVDDLFPARLHYFNDSSVVMRMRYGGQQTMWLGDVCETVSKLLRSRYAPSTFQSDFVQLAHHGLNGAERELYDLIGGKILLWSLRKGQIDDLLAKEPVEPHEFLAHYLLEEYGALEVYKHSSANYTFLLPYAPGSEGVIKR